MPGGPEPVAVTRSYVVCTMARTGSTLLCQYLRRTGVAGRPFELFLAKGERERWTDWGATSFAAYFDEFRARTVTPNGVVGAKVMAGQRERAVAQLRAAGFAPDGPDVAVLGAAFPRLRFVWLRRDDTVRQAISLWRAGATTQFHLRSHTERAPPPPFDFEEIEQRRVALEERDRGWQTWFAANGISPIVVTYEQFTRNRERVGRHLLRELGIEIPRGFALRRTRFARTARLRRLSDSTTEAYVAQYRREAESRA
jgi:LPS sulfotransferase NodH